MICNEQKKLSRPGGTYDLVSCSAEGEHRIHKGLVGVEDKEFSWRSKPKSKRKPAMFIKTTVKSRYKDYTNWICNSDRGGCGEQFFTDDKSKHRATCFKDVEKKPDNRKKCFECDGLWYNLRRKGEPGPAHWCD